MVLQFKANEPVAVSVYAPIPSDFYASDDVWYNEHDLVDVDFDVVLESSFTRDLLLGKFTPVNKPAIQFVAELILDAQS